jgi:hypothetical protein
MGKSVRPYVFRVHGYNFYFFCCLILRVSNIFRFLFVVFIALSFTSGTHGVYAVCCVYAPLSSRVHVPSTTPCFLSHSSQNCTKPNALIPWTFSYLLRSTHPRHHRQHP